ncbi:MarR family winged helix-turn-helix transcriptional regulator [Kitasatospora sp. RB6PN24]|uniref:MarR family winged helix-turn-helix transcriptional regulator n=1 Tax=Kitasatospora humi TaxID=2893891 RepID=UPI001E51E432|nr:MarR family winged helix-turn-helix transcriptional regulator [Kitasatospora humi]MCC9310132.1 MarR family winged helix-turn-helix transcriptional regulator [Kitasatospora humi]
MNKHLSPAVTGSPAEQRPGWRAKVPDGLSPRMRALVIDGSGIDRYRQGGCDTGSGAGRDTHRVTSAIATAFARAGSDRLALQDVLLSSPAPGGALLRDLARAKGHDHAVRYLGRVWRRAEQLVAASVPNTSRQDALVALVSIRVRVETHPWAGQAGQTDRANLLYRLRLCERAGGPEHELSQRQLALAIGVGDSTAKRSDLRLLAAGWLWRAEQGMAGKSSTWVLGAGPPGTVDGVSPVDPTCQEGHQAPGSLDGVNRRHPPELDFQVLTELAGRDAFRTAGLGKTALEVLAALAYRDGQTAIELANSTSRHRATIHAKLARLREHHLVEKDGEVYRLATGILDTPAQPQAGTRVPAWRPRDGWDDLALRLGTFGRSYRQWCEHAFDRLAYTEVHRRVREHRRPASPAPMLTTDDRAFLHEWSTHFEQAA